MMVTRADVVENGEDTRTGVRIRLTQEYRSEMQVYDFKHTTAGGMETRGIASCVCANSSEGIPAEKWRTQEGGSVLLRRQRRRVVGKGERRGRMSCHEGGREGGIGGERSMIGNAVEY